MIRTHRNLTTSTASFFSLLCLVLLFTPETAHVFAQPTQQEGTLSQARLETISFNVRQIPSDPSPLTLLEVHVSVFNPNQKTTFPPNSIKLAIVPREITFVPTAPKDQPDIQPEITTLNFALAPSTGRVLITAFSLPIAFVESVTFDIQINPPQGEKKTATWRRQ